MSLTTRLTEAFGIEHPVVLAPMDFVSDTRLTEAVNAAGGLGLLGGGYANDAWTRKQYENATEPLGCGFITWTLRGNEQVLDYVLEQRPPALFLSFSDPAPYAPQIKAAKVPLFCQVHNVEQTMHAIEVGADVIVAQGGEAGGHGLGRRGTFTLVPEVVDVVARNAPDVLVLAAGGVIDGRGLAAALALGADGAVVGTRFWAAQEAAIPRAAQQHALRLSGDDTIRQHVFDVVRGKPWPREYTGRVLRNEFVQKWHGREDELEQGIGDARAEFEAALIAEDYLTANITVGECVGRIHRIETTADIMNSMVEQASAILRQPTAHSV